MAENPVFAALRGPAVRVILAHHETQKAIRRRDADAANARLDDLAVALDDFEAAWTSLEAGRFHEDIGTAVDAALAQLRRRATHN